MEEFMDGELRVRSIDGSTRNYIREDGVKITKKKNGALSRHKGSKHRSGYIVISLGDGKGSTNAHRVVAKAFIPNPKELPMVDHIDNDSSNNHVTNLRWVTNKQNCMFYHTTQKDIEPLERSLEQELLALTNKQETVIGGLKEAIASLHLKVAELQSTIKDLLLGNPVDPTMLPAIGNILTVDGKTFGGTGSAATYILGMENTLGNSRNKETINKELKRFVKGTRPPWVMYDNYTIGY